MIGTVVWIKPCGERPNEQRATILAIADGHMMVKFCGDDSIECYPINYMCGIEVEEHHSIMFRAARELKETV